LYTVQLHYYQPNTFIKPFKKSKWLLKQQVIKMRKRKNKIIKYLKLSRIFISGVRGYLEQIS